MLAWAAAVALGREHGKFRQLAAVEVIVYNVEDERIEQRRRLSAVLRQFEAMPRDVRGKLIRTGPAGIGTLFARQVDGSLAATRAMERLRELIRERRPGLLIADPLAELHGVEENDNTALRAVIAEFRALAVEFNMAIILVHHTRKGAVAPGDPDAARGASSTIGAARIVLTLVTMSEEDADSFGLPKSRQARSQYVRLEDAKQNYAAIGDAGWYEKALCTLENGEVVAAALPWTPPDLWGAVDGCRQSNSRQDRSRARRRPPLLACFTSEGSCGLAGCLIVGTISTVREVERRLLAWSGSHSAVPASPMRRHEVRTSSGTPPRPACCGQAPRLTLLGPRSGIGRSTPRPITPKWTSSCCNRSRSLGQERRHVERGPDQVHRSSSLARLQVSYPAIAARELRQLCRGAWGRVRPDCSRARLTWGSQVKRIRLSFLRVPDPKSEPFMIRAGLPVHRIKLTHGRRCITVVPISRLRRA
jgi:AAA domain